MNKSSFLRFLIIAPGIIAGFLLVGTTLAYIGSAIYSQFIFDVGDYPFPISTLLVFILYPTDIVSEYFQELFSLSENMFVIFWFTLLTVITSISFFMYRRIK
jgi:hypothetical protein